jgi:TolA-binding protein
MNALLTLIAGAGAGAIAMIFRYERTLTRLRQAQRARAAELESQGWDHVGEIDHLRHELHRARAENQELRELVRRLDTDDAPV